MWSGGNEAWVEGATPHLRMRPPLNGRSSHLIEAAKRGRLDQMIFFSAPLTTRAPPRRPAGRPAERPGAVSAASARMARRVGLFCAPLYPLGSSSARGLVRSAGAIILGSKIALFPIFSIFFRFFGLPNNALKFASKK